MTGSLPFSDDLLLLAVHRVMREPDSGDARAQLAQGLAEALLTLPADEFIAAFRSQAPKLREALERGIGGQRPS